MKTILLKLSNILLLFWGCQNLHSQHSTQETITKLYGANALDTRVDFGIIPPTDTAAYRSLTKILKVIVEEERNQKIAKGNVSIGLNSSEVPSKSNTSFNAGFGGSRGTYPDKLSFQSDILISLNEGKFQEDFSSLSINFDRYFHPRWEIFSFIDRFSNIQAGITDRYELGGGLVFEVGDKYYNSKKDNLSEFLIDKRRNIRDHRHTHLTAKGKSKIKSIENLDLLSATASFDNQLQDKSQKATLHKELHDAFERTYNSIISDYQKFRLAFLAGLFCEIENAKVAESVTYIDTTGSGIIVPVTETLNMDLQSQTWRWEFRPTMEWRPGDGYGFKIRPYLKVPLVPFKSWDQDYLVIENDIIATDKRADYRIDAQFEFFMTGKFTPSVRYRLIYDNAPPQALIKPLRQDASILVTENKLLHIIQFNLKYNFE